MMSHFALGVAVCVGALVPVLTGCTHRQPVSPDRTLLSLAGEPVADIVVARDASPVVRHAATELSSFLAQVVGKPFPIVHEPGTAKHHLLVGPKASRLVDPSVKVNGLGKEGIVIRTVGDCTMIFGGTGRGTLYAVHTFLEDYVGCRWWAKNATSIPRKLDLSIPAEVDLRHIPTLEYRWPSWRHANNDADTSVRNKVNGPKRLQEPKYGGRMYHGRVHTFYQFIPPEIYFNKHPEWFSEIKGKRTHERAQLCLSNSAMRKELVRRLKAEVKRDPSRPVISVSQNDWGGYCTCEACKRLDRRYGGQSGVMIWFVNQVAKEIEADLPHLSISTLAYQYTRKPPRSAIRPRKNVIVLLCSFECDFSIPLSHDRNRSFRDDLRAWSTVTDRLYVWDYGTNFDHYLLPHPNLRVLAPNIRFLVRHNVKGIYEQGAHTSRGAELEELRVWVLAKLLWDPSLKADELIRTFVHGYYSKNAAPYLLQYIDLMHDAVEASGEGLGIFCRTNAKFLSFDTLSKAWELLRSAERAVAGDRVLRSRVKKAQLPLMYAFIMNWESLREQCLGAKATWPVPEDVNELAQELKRIAKANKIRRLSERVDGYGAIDSAVKKIQTAGQRNGRLKRERED